MAEKIGFNMNLIMSWSEWMLVGEEKERLTSRAVSIIEDEILSLSSKKSSKAYSVVLVEELFDNNQELSDEDITNAEDILTTILEDLKCFFIKHNDSYYLFKEKYDDEEMIYIIETDMHLKTKFKVTALFLLVFLIILLRVCSFIANWRS